MSDAYRNKETASSLSQNFILDPNAVSETAESANSVLSSANSYVETAKGLIASVQGLAGSVPAKAKYAALPSTCEKALADLAVADYLSYGADLRSTLDTLVETALLADAQTAEQIGVMIEAMNRAGMEAKELTGLIHYRTKAGTYEEYLEHVKKIWDSHYRPERYNPKEERARLIRNLTYYGVYPQTQVVSKDPVNLCNGNFLYDRTDISIKGSIPLTIKRFYNAKDKKAGAFGKGWRHTYEESIKKQDGSYCHIRNDGAEESFYRNEENLLISVLEPETCLMEEETGYCMEYRGGNRKYFDKTGKFVREEQSDGKGIRLTYDTEGYLRAVTADTGESLTFLYTQDAFLESICDHTGRKVQYHYGEDKRMEQVVMADGAGYTYSYDERQRITGIENPQEVMSVQNQYDEKDRVIRQDFPDGGSMLFTYDEEKKATVLQERNGSLITYLMDKEGRHVGTVDEAGTIRYTYNRFNRKNSFTDRRGNTTRLAYDNRGNLKMLMNPRGNKLHITYNDKALPEVVKDMRGAKTTYAYNETGQVTEIRDAEGNSRKYFYNTCGQMEKIQLAEEAFWHMKYDARGNVICIKRPDGSNWRYEYDVLNRVSASIDGNGNRTAYEYDSRDRITKVTDSRGNTRSYIYNASGKVTQMKDFDQHTICYQYNTLNKPVLIKDKEGNETKYDYDLMWNISRVTMPDGAEIKYAYDGLERLIQVTLPNGGNICYEYDADGNRTGVTDAEGNHTAYQYDSVNRIIKVTMPDGAEHKYTYDAAGNLTMEEDPLGNKRTFFYDMLGRKTAETDFLGNKTEYTYDSLSNIIQICYQNGTMQKRSYDSGGRLIKRILPSGRWETYEYDKNSNLVKTTDQSGNISCYEYDAADKLTAFYKQGGGVRKWAYDAMGRITAMTDENANTTCYAYSPSGNLLSVTDALGNKAYYEYDAMGRLITVNRSDETAGTNRRTTCLYDLMGLPALVTDALGNEERYRYDLNGRLISKTDRDGYETVYAYTKTGNIKTIDYADEKTVRYEYDALRHLTKVQDWNGEIDIENDAMGRALHVTDQDGKKISYTYGSMGEHTSLTYPDGMTAAYDYDEHTRLNALRKGDTVITYEYDSLGRLTGKHFPNGMKTQYQYDVKNHISMLTHSDAQGILDSYIYRYDLVGNKTHVCKKRRGLEQESGEYSYTYDALNRVSCVSKDGLLLRTYEYDPYGNRTVLREKNSITQYAYNEADQLITKTDPNGVTSYAYDNRGNLNLVMENGAMKYCYTYGALNRLEEAVNAAGERAAYRYNGLGYRIGKTEADGRTETGQGSRTIETEIRYLTDLTKGYHNLLQKQEGDSLQSFLWDGNVAGIVEKGNIPEETDTQYYFQDELGSPLRLADRNGRLTETYGYDEFGQELYQNHDIKTKRQPFGFTGYQTDCIAGTYYAQAREYLPKTGRFAGRDLIKGYASMPKTLNEYGYCWGNPVNYVDLDGREAEEADYSIYYLNNMDGAKGLGHSAILLVDEDGQGDFYSYMGGGNDIWQTITQWTGGYIAHKQLNNTEVNNLLATGDIWIEMQNKKKNFDNYDRALVNEIAESDYVKIIEKANDYCNNPPNYQMFGYNCDSFAVELISIVTPDIKMPELMPNNSFYMRGKEWKDWELISIGKSSITERLLSVPGGYYWLRGIFSGGKKYEESEKE